MKTLSRIFVAAALLGIGAAQATEITVCIVDATIKNNQNYQGLATTNTRMFCEIDKPNYRPTLRELYQDGWHLIAIGGADQAFAQGGTNVRSPLYYLEREAAPSGAGESSKPAESGASPAPEQKRKPFSLF